MVCLPDATGAVIPRGRPTPTRRGSAEDRLVQIERAP
jgi:hypothetical protein